MFHRIANLAPGIRLLVLVGGGIALWRAGGMKPDESVGRVAATATIRLPMPSVEERRDRVRWVLGTHDSQPVLPNVRVESMADHGDHVRRLISYDVADYDRASAWVFIPFSAAKSPRPVVLCLHQTVACGKDEPAGLAGRASLHVAPELVRRGFVCIMADHFAAGARVARGNRPYDTAGLYQRHPEWSAGGKALWDLQRLLDLLVGMPEVDCDRIGVLGVSLGGHDALLLAAMDQRIRAAVVISGSRIMRADPNRANWSRTEAGDFVAYPRLRPYMDDPASLPFDFDDLMYLVSPRSLLMLRDIAGDEDPTKRSLDAVLYDVRSHDSSAPIEVIYHRLGHDFPPSLHKRAYDWLEQNLGRAD